MTTSDRSVLDIDVGNSRIKWRVRQFGAETLGFIDRADASKLEAWPLFQPDRVRVSSVASAIDNQELHRLLEQRFKRTPEFAKSSRSLAGLVCGYEEPARLGVDRWLAMLAARRIEAGAFVIIDIGTAATIDFVAADGLHRGGYIVPGLRLMAAALLRGTADVRVTFEAAERVVDPGRNTAAAVRGGLVLMLADFARNSIGRFARECIEPPRVLLCGGDASFIAPLLDAPVEIHAELVLDGLAIALP